MHEEPDLPIPDLGQNVPYDDEKVDEDPNEDRPVPEQQPRFFTSRQLIIICLGLTILVLQAPSTIFYLSISLNHLFDNSPIITDGPFEWGPCDEDRFPLGTQCGYVDVPKDYTSKTSNSTYSLAVARIPATRKPKKGTLFFMHGGIGGSIKDMVLEQSPWLHSILGEDHDIVAVDPRGLGDSEPRVRCFSQDFPHQVFIRNTVLEKGLEIGSNQSLPEARLLLRSQLEEANKIYRAQFEVCEREMGKDLRYLSTTAVARDFEFIATYLDGKDAPINFFGGGYGSIVGQYLINMFPGRVGRVVLDGVADVEAWTNEQPHLSHRKHLAAVEATYDLFLSRCSRESCELAKFAGEDPALIRARIDSLFDRLAAEPLAVPRAVRPGFLTSGRARKLLLLALESPSSWFSAYDCFSDALNGEGISVMNGYLSRFLPEPYDPWYEPIEEWYPEPAGANGCPIDIHSAVPTFPFPGFKTIDPDYGRYARCMVESHRKRYRDLERSVFACNDKRWLPTPNIDEVVEEVLETYHNVSHFVLDTMMSRPDSGCQYWLDRPVERFEGPWNHTLRNPILILGNTANPATPLSVGKNLATALGNSSRLLVQDTPGRGTFALPSLCTARFVQEYMRSGTLPPAGTLCKSLSPEDYQKWEAYSELTEQEETLLVNLEIIGAEVDRMGGGLHVG